MTESSASSLEHGHYARKQLYCKDRLIAWSHQRRFELALQLSRSFAGKTVLDYGCGDGTFLTLLMNSPSSPSRAVGAEVGADQIDDCRKRLGHIPTLSFLPINELDHPDHKHLYDCIVCTEVLEHVVDRAQALDRFQRLLAGGGILIVSVPVEIGLPLAVKQAARRVAGWRRLGDYAFTERYSWRESVRSFCAGDTQHLERPIYGAAQGRPYHGHKGFNWKVLRREIRQRFKLERTLTSPLSWGGPQLASQVWFVARKK